MDARPSCGESATRTEIENRTRTGKQARSLSIEIGESLPFLFAKILGKPGVLSTKQEDYVFLNISLIDVYDHLVQVLIDGDPQSLLAVFPSCES